MTTRRWSRKVQDCCLAITLCISSGICQGADPPVFSGPQPGEKLSDLQVRGLFGELAGKELNLLKEAGTRPTLFIFVHELTRPGNSLTQALMRYVEQHPKELYGSLIFLGDDLTALEGRLKRAQHALPKKAPVTISLDGKEGPGSYGLNRKVTLTIVFARDHKVVSNVALISPSLQADTMRILKPVVKVIGGKMPTLADLSPRRPVARKPGTRPAAGASKQKIDLRPLLGPVIRKEASAEEVERAAQAAEKYFVKHPDFAQQAGRAARRIIAAGKLGNYGTEAAQRYLKKWAAQFPEPIKKPPGEPEKSSGTRQRGQQPDR
ncbi:MAG: hypothetical protein VB877_07490 [Pirellulaceae bacterium]